MAKIKDVDMTQGNLFWKIILFALPVLGTTVMQLLYVSIDLMTVHYGDSAESMGAIASNTALINLIIVVFTGVSLGVNVCLSESRGANDRERGERIVHTGLLFALISGIAVGVIGFLISDNLLAMMGTEAHYMEKATLYLRIYFSGLPFLMIYNYASQILRAQGDSHTPFLALVISGLANVGLDCLLVFPFKLGVAGVGIATIVAEAISCVLLIIVLLKKKTLFAYLQPKKLRLDGKAMLEILKVGLPAGLQGFFFSLPNVFIQSSLYTIDPSNVNLENGAIAAGNIEAYFVAIVDALATSAMTFIAANIGAKRKENIVKTALFGAAWGGVAAVFVALFTLFLYRPVLLLFVDNEAAIEAGRQRLFITGLWFSFNFLMNYSAGLLKGMKKSYLPMITTMVFCTGLRILLIFTLFTLEQFHTITWLYALFPITWVIAFITNAIIIAIVMPKLFRSLDKANSTLNESPNEIAE